jgi:hypothetical protein
MSELIPELVWTQEEVTEVYGGPAAFSANGTAWVTINGEQWAIGTRAEYCPEVPLPAASWLFISAVIGLIAMKRRHG